MDQRRGVGGGEHDRDGRLHHEWFSAGRSEIAVARARGVVHRRNPRRAGSTPSIFNMVRFTTGSVFQYSEARQMSRDNALILARFTIQNSPLTSASTASGAPKIRTIQIIQRRAAMAISRLPPRPIADLSLNPPSAGRAGVAAFPPASRSSHRSWPTDDNRAVVAERNSRRPCPT